MILIVLKSSQKPVLRDESVQKDEMLRNAKIKTNLELGNVERRYKITRGIMLRGVTKHTRDNVERHYKTGTC